MSLSDRIEATTTQSRSGRRSSSQSSPAGLCAPSHSSSAPRHSSRPWNERGPLGLAEDGDRAGLHDGELLARDRLGGVAEHVGVFQRDVREQDDSRVDHIRRVVATAQSGFDDRDVDLLRAELRQRGGGEDLELGRSFGVRAHAVDRALEVRVVAADTDPLRPRPHVRGVVRADVPSLCGEERLDRAGRGSLAVRSDDVNGRIRLLRVAEVGQQPAHPLEPELVGPRAQAFDPASC